jgi:sugar lactone lactonase YvrE
MSESNSLTVETPLLEIGCTLGEGQSTLLALPRSNKCAGPLYDPSTGILHFVDIKQKRLYHYDTASSTLVFDEFDEPVTALALRQNGQGVSP